EVLGLPVQHVAEQHGGLVVEVVPGGDDVEAAGAGHLVEQVALGQPARRAGHPAGDGGGRGDVVAVLLAQVDAVERQAPALGEGHRRRRAGLAVAADAEVDVQPLGPVAQLDEQVPQGEAVLAARHRHEDAVVGSEHAVLGDRLGDLVTAEPQEVLAAEVGVVAAQVDDGLAPADGALHEAPPEITGRISTVSSSDSTASPATRVSPRTTSTDSRLRSSWRRSLVTEIGPATSSS